MTSNPSYKFSVTQGIDIPIGGCPEQKIYDGADSRRVALLGRDYLGMKPAMLVQEGDNVKLGAPLFSDKKNPGVIFTSPACGRVESINRGEKRAFLSLVIEIDGDEEVSYSKLSNVEIQNLSREEAEKRLIESGLWTSFRTRPFSKIPPPGSTPSAIFVSAIDTNPLAPDPALIISEQKDSFTAGLKVVQTMTDGSVYLCHSQKTEIPTVDGIIRASFSGCHPAGLPGTHIHYLHPVSMNRNVWQIGYQDLIAIGTLFLSGRINPSRVISLAGSGVKKPRLIRTRLGAELISQTEGELNEAEQRIISGSVLSGFSATNESAYLGRYHNQVSVLPEDRSRRFLDWLMPGFQKHSVKRLFAASFSPRKVYDFTTCSHGSLRAMVPIGAYEKVMPLDIKITLLLRSILAGDLEMAKALGCLELDEEDLALCSYVCPGKIDYGFHLRQILTRIEEEGE